MKFIYNISWIMILLVIFSSCEKDMLTYDNDQDNGVYFNIRHHQSGAHLDTLFYGLGVQAVDSVIFNIPIRITGLASNEDKVLNYEVVSDSTTAVEDFHYSIADIILKAGEYETSMPITLYRGDTLLADSTFRLDLRLVTDENFRAIINPSLELTFTDVLGVQPLWWLKYGRSMLGNYSAQHFVYFIQFYHAYEFINKEIYDEMVNEYGLYFEKFPESYDEKRIFQENANKISVYKHILIPLYNFYEENSELKAELGITMKDPSNYM